MFGHLGDFGFAQLGDFIWCLDLAYEVGLLQDATGRGGGGMGSLSGGFLWDRADAGASLPPRKRLLAGLKQNGWLSSSPSSTSSSSYSSVWHSLRSPSAGLTAEVQLEVDLQVETEKPDVGGQCADHRAEEITSREGMNVSEDTNSVKCENESNPSSCMSSPASNSPVPAGKKPLVGRALRCSNVESKDGGTSSRIKTSSASKLGVGSKRKSVSTEEMAAAAKLTAAIAAKTFAVAKATAAVKAAVAAKTAALAKVALEAAALAACDEASNLERSSTRRREKNKMAELKGDSEQEDRVSQMLPAIDDEELARRLHRAINSSPRISRSQSTTWQPKEAGKPLELIPATEGLSCGSGSLSHGSLRGRQHRMKPRASYLKEVENQEMKIKMEKSERSQTGNFVELQFNNDCNKSMPSETAISVERAASSASDCASNRIADFAVSQEHLDIAECPKPVGKQSMDCRMTQLDNLTPVHKDYIPDSTLVSYSNTVDFNQKMFAGGDLKVRSVENVPSQLMEEDVKQEALLVIQKQSCTDVIVSEGRLMGVGQTMPNASAVKDLDTVDQGDAGGLVKDPIDETSAAEEGGENPGLIMRKLNYYSEVSGFSKYITEEEKLKSSILEAQDWPSVKNSIPKPRRSLNKHKCSDEISGSVAKVQPQGHGGGSSWHQGILKGLSSGSQPFGGNTNLNSFRSAPPIPLRTPAFASGPTGRHS